MMVLLKVLIGLTFILLLLIIGVKFSDNFNRFKVTQMCKRISECVDWILLIIFFGTIIGGSYYLGDIFITFIKG